MAEALSETERGPVPDAYSQHAGNIHHAHELAPRTWRRSRRGGRRTAPSGLGYGVGNSLAKTPTGTLTWVAAGTRLAPEDFKVLHVRAASGWNVSNPRDLTPA